MGECLYLSHTHVKWKASSPPPRYAQNTHIFVCLSTSAPPSLAHVAALRRPEAAASASDLAGGVELLIVLRGAFLQTTTTAAAAADEDEGNDEEQRRVGRLLVAADARAR